MLQIENLSISFANKSVINNLSLHIQHNEIFGLVGPDGAGKTTLLRTICSLLDPEMGQILIDKQLASDFPREYMGYMPQKFSLYSDLTVMENIEFFSSLYQINKKTICERAKLLLTMTGLSSFTHRLADNLSGGMKQKLALTCALITRPHLLVLDEPTFGVDPESRKEFWQILYQLNKDGMTIIVTTPYMDEAELCHRIALINQGKLVACAAPAELKKLFQNRVLAVRTSIPDPDFFEDYPGVLSSSYYSGRFQLLVDDASRRCSEIEVFIRQLDTGTAAVYAAIPSMEDVFTFLAEVRSIKDGI